MESLLFKQYESYLYKLCERDLMKSGIHRKKL